MSVDLSAVKTVQYAYLPNFPTTHQPSDVKENAELKTKLINNLVRQNYSSSLDVDTNDPAWEETIKQELQSCSFKRVDLLHQLLIPLFQNQTIYNQDRLEIIRNFRSLPFDSWEKFGKQIQYLTPRNARGADIRNFQTILCTIKDLSFADLLVRVANQLFDWNMTSNDKVIILEKLREKDVTELNSINNLSVEQKIEYAKDLL